MDRTDRIAGSWIWVDQIDRNKEHGGGAVGGDEYNLSARFRKKFPVAGAVEGRIAVTADSWYRLAVNGRIVADGPARAWPEHYSYDVLDISAYLCPGENNIEALVRYFGTGTFHGIAKRPGFLADVVIRGEARELRFSSDRTWEAAPVPELQRDTPKISIQMEPFEHWDAGLGGEIAWAPAVEICAAHEGPWQDLSPRDVALLTREPEAARAVLPPSAVDPGGEFFCFSVARMVYPGLIEAQHNTALPLGAAVIVESGAEKRIRLAGDGFRLYLNGSPVSPEPHPAVPYEQRREFAEIRLHGGENFLLAIPERIHGHHKDWTVAVLDEEPQIPHTWKHPGGGAGTSPDGGGGPWSCFVVESLKRSGDDMIFMFHPDTERDELQKRAAGIFDRIAATVKDGESYARLAGDKDISIIPSPVICDDPHYRFMNRLPLSREAAASPEASLPRIEDPNAMLYDTAECSVLHPAGQGDTEFVLDFGLQRCGYYEIDLFASRGVIVDIFGVEYVDGEGHIQHTRGNRNGMRFVCTEGWNRFQSLKRRSGRYLFVTLRNCREPVRIRRIGLVESVYPAGAAGSFRCSDSTLERIWEISVRTLELCMEDTYTDCPLYEQTLWVGDARNEALYALAQFGAADITRRCLRLAAESLERYPIVGCQVPSAWDCLLPAWSFMWGISVKDYYQWSGDTAFLKEMWPHVRRNLEGALKMLDERGLFSGPYWNMFDWSKSDFTHETVVHNTMFMIGALDAAVACAETLDLQNDARAFVEKREELAAAVEATWDDGRGAYPDSFHADGTASPVSSVHTSALALLYDIVGPERRKQARQHLTHPLDGMVPISSPFAMQYLFEAMEASGMQEKIVAAIAGYYTPMIAAGSSTVWEVLPISKDHPAGFPTRSHCHAWSASPAFYLPRIILGIRPEAPGWRRVVVSPRTCGLTQATGAVATPLGPVRVSWTIEDTTLHIRTECPEAVVLRFEPNDSLAGMQITVNGQAFSG